MQSTLARVPLAGRLFLDVGLLVSMILLVDPRALGIALHEWLGIVIAPVLLFHLTLNWPWIVQVTKKLRDRLPMETRINRALDLLLFLFMTISIWSGILISESALPTMGLPVGASSVWRGVHETSSNGVLVIVGVHFAVHWQWVVRSVRRLFGVASPRWTQASGKAGN